MVNILLLEDEKYTREFIKKLLLENPLVNQVFDTGSGREAIALAKDHQMTIGLFDIELEEESANGLEVAKNIHKMCPEMDMVFVTGYAKYAIDSFSVHPFDYLLKPINRQRLMETINTLAHKKLGVEKDRIIVRGKNETVFISFQDILYIEKCNNLITIHCAENEFISNSTLGEAEKVLPEYFLRVHKSYIINKTMVKKLVDIGNKSYEIHFFHSSKTAYMSRYKYYELKESFIPSI